MAATLQNKDEAQVRSYLVSLVTTDLPWDASFSREPLCPETSVTFSSDSVGVLTHYVKIRPRFNAPTNTLHGYRVTRYHESQEDAFIVASSLRSFDDAISEARDCMEQLTP